MSLATDLLNSLPADQMDENDDTLVINHYTRSIAIPKKITALGVERDDDVLRLNFRMPRYIGNVDLSPFSIRINYLNAIGDSDVYTVSDARVVGNDICFSWLVGPTATAYKGSTKFNVCMRTFTSGDIVDKEYNTAIASLPVLEGMEADESVVSEYSDILEQWRRELFGIGDTEEASIRSVSAQEQENIVKKGAEVLATIPEDYQTTYEMADESARTKADAIVCEAAGTTISIEDSSDDYIRGLKVYGKSTQATTTGKNLCSLNNITFTQMEHVALVNPIPAGTYYLTLIATSTDTDDTDCVINFYNDDGHVGGARFERGKRINHQITLTHDATEMYCYASESFIAGENDEATFSNIMVSIDENSYYEPYTGGIPAPNPDYPLELESVDNPTVNVCGKNLLVFNLEGSLTANGITITDNGDGGILVTGTATAYAEFAIFGRYKDTSHGFGFDTTLSGGTSDSRLIAFRYKNGVYINAISSQGSAVTVESSDGLCIVISVPESTTVNNVIYPMLTVTATDNEFKKHKSIQSLTIPRTLPGIPVATGGNYTDKNGQQWICDEIDFERGVYVQRIAEYTFTGNEPWTLHESNRYYSSINNDSGYTFLSQRSLCSHVSTSPNSARGNYGSNGTSGFYFNQSDTFNTLDDLVSFLRSNSVTVLLALKYPIETPLTAEEVAAFKALKTNYPNTTILNDAGAWMSVKYNADTKSYVENPKTLKLTDSSTGVVYELKIINGQLTVVKV